MSDDIRYGIMWLLICAGIALIIAVIVCPIAYYQSTTAKAAIAAGMIETPDVHQSGTHWTKP